MKVAFLFEFTEVGIQLQCKGHVRGKWDRQGVVVSQGNNLDEYLVQDS